MEIVEEQEHRESHNIEEDLGNMHQKLPRRREQVFCFVFEGDEDGSTWGVHVLLSSQLRGLMTRRLDIISVARAGTAKGILLAYRHKLRRQASLLDFTCSLLVSAGRLALLWHQISTPSHVHSGAQGQALVEKLDQLLGRAKTEMIEDYDLPPATDGFVWQATTPSRSCMPMEMEQHYADRALRIPE